MKIELVVFVIKKGQEVKFHLHVLIVEKMETPKDSLLEDVLFVENYYNFILIKIIKKFY